jgi:alkaline phosphatase D
MAASEARFNVIAQQTLFTPKDEGSEGRRRVWTDGWDGYPASQQRLLKALSRPGLSNPLLIGGDIHANVVCNVQADPWAGSPVLAAEVCGTSMSSQGWPQERMDESARKNPHHQWARSDRRGYVLVELGRNADVALR